MFTFRLDADGSYRRHLSFLEQRLSRWADAGVGQAMIRAMEDHHKGLFNTGGAGAGGRGSGYGSWSSLRASTLRARGWRRRVSRIAPRDYAGPVAGDGVLFWSGRLRSSLTGERLAGANGNDSIRRVNLRAVTFGTACPTALFHAAGRSGRNPMPVRQPMDDVVAPQVAMDVAEARIMAFLTADQAGWLPPEVR